MTAWLSWTALAFVIVQLWLMGSNMYRLGWWCAIAACFAWGGYAWTINALPLALQQMVIFALSVRALKNLED